VLVEARAQPLQPLADEAPLVVELLLADLPRHVEPDRAVLLRLHARQLALGARGILGLAAVLVRVQRRQPGRDQVRVLEHAPDLAPDQLLEPLGADERVLAAAQAVGCPHPVAVVVAARRSRSTALLRHAPTSVVAFCAPSISHGFTNDPEQEATTLLARRESGRSPSIARVVDPLTTTFTAVDDAEAGRNASTGSRSATPRS